jgi:hypothetical protein
MKATKLEKFETVLKPANTAEQELKEWEQIFNELLEIGQKLPPDSSPAQTLKDVLSDFHKPKTTIVQRQDGTKLIVRDGVVTVISPTEVTEISSPIVTDTDEIKATTFTKEELEILETLKNG